MTRILQIGLCLGFLAAGSIGVTTLLTVTSTHAEEYAGAPQKVRLKIGGMMCASCEKKIQAKLKGMDGIKGVRINRVKGWAEVTYLSGKFTPDQIVRAFNAAGDGDFKATVASVSR